jgi:hypothetical protein
MAPEDRIKEYVYAGMVLDERGNWITLVEKLKKERVFQKHLENGEILRNGKWTHISKIKLQQEHLIGEDSSIDPEAVVEEETTIVSVHKIHKEQQAEPSPPLETPEETVSIETELIRGPALDGKDDDDDFPAETTVFKIDRTGDTVRIEFPEASGKSTEGGLINGETQMDFSIDTPGRAQQDSIVETEFQETVLYNINVLKEDESRKIAAKAAENSSPRRKSAFYESIHQSHKVEMDRLKKRNGITAGVILLLAGLVVFLLVKNLI